MEKSLKTNSPSASQETVSILWNPKVHYRDHNSSPIIPILRPINPVHAKENDLRSILILSSHLRLRLPSGLFPSGFRIKI
jgi:hypothetical protein